MRTVGTVVRGIRAPIIKQGDDLIAVVVNSLRESWEVEGYKINDGDVIGITESLVARAQGNYVTVDAIAQEIRQKFGGEVGVVFPILSRNRFSMILKGIAKGSDRIILLLSYPSDEVGNHIMDVDKMYDLGIDPYRDVLSENDYRRLFGQKVEHPFTKIDYVTMYREIAGDCKPEIYFANDPKVILKYTKKVLAADIHNRARTKKVLKNAGAQIVYGLDELCTSESTINGYNPEYGLLGSNKADEERLKLFPRNGKYYVNEIQKKVFELTNKHVEVMIYGDGAFKDPVGKIWELADPVVSPAFTSGLSGTLNEIKIKYFADSKLTHLSGQEIDEAMKNCIRGKKQNLAASTDSLGTTPRQLTDLLGSLCDLTSGSGDKGTPIVLVQGYFDNFATE